MASVYTWSFDAIHARMPVLATHTSEPKETQATSFGSCLVSSFPSLLYVLIDAIHTRKPCLQPTRADNTMAKRSKISPSGGSESTNVPLKVSSWSRGQPQVEAVDTSERLPIPTKQSLKYRETKTTLRQNLHRSDTVPVRAVRRAPPLAP